METSFKRVEFTLTAMCSVFAVSSYLHCANFLDVQHKEVTDLYHTESPGLLYRPFIVSRK